MSNNVTFNSFPPALERSFLHFLRTFKNEEGIPKYVRQVEQLLSSRLTKTVYIDVNDMINFSIENNKSGNDSNIEERNTNGLISGQTMLLALTEQYGEYKQAIDNLVTSFCKSFTIGDERGDGRLDPGFGGYTASFFGLRWIESLRTLRCEKLGKLCSLRGTITRTSDVRPELLKACFECEICGCIVDNVVQQFVYSLPSVCPTKGCGNRTAWQLRLENCEFGDWQKLRIQEHATEIPPGSMPRSMNVILRGDFVDKCKPGDKVIFTGMLIVAPDVPSLMKPGEIPSSVYKDRSRSQNESYNSGISGLKSLGVRDLAYRLCFLACHIEVVNAIASTDDGRIIEQINHNHHHNQGTEGIENNNELNQVEMEVNQELGANTSLMIDHLKALNVQETSLRKFLEISQHPNGINMLARYVAPHVYGYSQLKKGILLLLVGGVEKRTKDNIKLRGDINVCIVGDPSTAKSQILRFVNEFSTRTVYTSGKSSTAAGLTASIHRDPDQGDFVIEAGALMLADKGICCIDEFDKMDDKDVVAIHEAMEQQTISITKAGVLATLNARASVLAACSPLGGRYNPSKTLSQNVKISAPILSRFDLFFVMIDDPEDVYDEVLASFIVGLHSKATEGSGREVTQDEMFNQKQFIDHLSFSDPNNLQLSKSELNQYIAYAKTFKPCITPAAKTILVRTYKALRMGDATSGAKAMRITVRQLESLIRLSEAVAKLRFSYLVTPEHVEEACQIFKSSLSKIRYNDIDLGDMDEYDDEDEEEEEENMKDLTGMEDERSHRLEKVGNKDDQYSDGEDNTKMLQELQVSKNVRASSKNKKKANVTIGYNEYFQIARRFVDKLQSSENSEISITDLITWHISEYDHPESEEELGELEEKYHRAIQRMIHRDMILYISFQEEIMSQRNQPENDQEEENEVILMTYVKVHPNYNVNDTITLPQPSSGNKPLTRHADFGYRTFQNTEEANGSYRDSQEIGKENDILNLNENLEPEDFLPEMEDSQSKEYQTDKILQEEEEEEEEGEDGEGDDEELDDGASSRV
ncbi:DNA replication licensing factor MCM6-like AAA ATpase [Cryptosporidium sp. chipmunk genotype I]|uniref:DNA replication licensing factor MCM6-like AAA ATpase n=1 Tax=Cryptosporidium sp. chipmunk genotype I TaxID=1280935 RepID=UPI00351A4428|nr:DNA replication licensing factor MCM6-like AAA ATpase [Cryptosporidium sp. chipmunk genotype I]